MPISVTRGSPSGSVDMTSSNIDRASTLDASLDIVDGGNLILPMTFPELHFQGGVPPENPATQISTDINMPDLTALNMPLSGENAFFNLPENDILGEFWQTPVMVCHTARGPRHPLTLFT